jgi:hypothetical protein
VSGNEQLRAAPKSSDAFRQVVSELLALEENLLGSDTTLDSQGVLEGYKWLFSILAVGLDAHVWADPARPRFVDIVGPYKKWGGDNADAFYQYAPIDPTRTYRITGTRLDSVYLSLTVYGGPRDGRYSERIVGTINDRELEFGTDGSFELWLGPQPRNDGVWLKLEPDAVCAITRDYLVDARTGRRATFEIESIDPPEAWRETDEDLARRLTATLTWIKEQATIVPLPLGEPNHVDDPYPVPQTTFGWAAGDAAYAMGSFDLGEDEALLLEGTSPQCAFWNMCLWNPFLHTYNYDYERVTINGGKVHYEPDGSWRIVVAHSDPAHPNWVSTAGHPRGRIWFRWFLPSETPQRVEARVVGIDAVT